MAIVIRGFDPVDATGAELAAYHRVVRAAQVVDRPEDPPVTPEAVAGRLRTPVPEFGPVRHWLAHDGGELAGVAWAHHPDAGNAHLLIADVTVHPGHRRRGVGTALLDTLRAELRRTGRTAIEGVELTKGGAGERWANALGFRTTHEAVVQFLVVAGTDRARWDVPTPPDYRLVHWTGRAPDELVDSYARARRAVRDAPLGDTGYLPPDWTAERVRAEEAELAAQGVRSRVVVAVHEATGEVAGASELHVRPQRPRWGAQRDTSVRAGHRGRGLGLAVKGLLYRNLLADLPDVELIHTGTGARNAHMIRVNEALGFTTARTTVNVRLDAPPPAPRR